MADKANWEGVSITEDNKVIAEGGFEGITAGGEASLSESTATYIDPTESLVLLTPTAATVQWRINAGVDGQRLTLVHTNTNESLVRTVGDYSVDTSLNVAGEWLELIFSTTAGGWIALGTNGAQN